MNKHLGYAHKETAMAAALFAISIIVVCSVFILALLRWMHFVKHDFIY